MNQFNTIEELRKRIEELEVQKKQLESQNNNLSVKMGQCYGSISPVEFTNLVSKQEENKTQIKEIEKELNRITEILSAMEMKKQ